VTAKKRGGDFDRVRRLRHQLNIQRPPFEFEKREQSFSVKLVGGDYAKLSEKGTKGERALRGRREEGAADNRLSTARYDPG